MDYPYEAIINGKRRKITGVDEGGNYFLNGGEKLKFKPFGTDTYLAWKLKKISALSFTRGRWLLDKESLIFQSVKTSLVRKNSSEARTEHETLSHLLFGALNRMSSEDRGKIKGVAWFDECVDGLEGETQEDCDRRKEIVDHYTGGNVKIHPLPPANLFKPVLLADFGIFKESASRQRSGNDSYEAVIKGEKRQVSGFDEDENLVLADGQRYIFERLNFNAPGQPAEEPDGDIFGWPLLEVAKLQQWQDDWKWNNEQKPLSQYLKAHQQTRSPHYRTTDAFNRAIVNGILKKLPEVVQKTVRAVAWFKLEDGTGGLNTPILLKSFRPLAKNASPKVEAAKSVPDYFTNIKDAAAYAGKSERTILNWKKREWLKVEQDGKKIRIAKTELDKCISKQ